MGKGLERREGEGGEGIRGRREGEGGDGIRGEKGRVGKGLEERRGG